MTPGQARAACIDPMSFVRSKIEHAASHGYGFTKILFHAIYNQDKPYQLADSRWLFDADDIAALRERIANERFGNDQWTVKGISPDDLEPGTNGFIVQWMAQAN